MAKDQGSSHHYPNVEYEVESSQYFEERQLRKGNAGWGSLAGLGVSYVVAGLYAAWNYGVGEAGWGGMVVALAIMSVMFFGLVFSIAELATIVPTSGGGYGFARRAFGPMMGLVVGLAQVLQYIIATGVIAMFFCAYLKSLTGLDGIWVLVALYAGCFIFHIMQAKESLLLTLVIALIASTGLAVFTIAMAPAFSFAHLVDLPVNEAAYGASPLFPQGWIGVWAGLPFAMTMFMGVEGVPFAAEEAKDAKRDLPKGMIVAIVCLFIFSLLILCFGPGASGASVIETSEDPLMTAMKATLPDGHWARLIVNIAGVSAVFGSFFAVIFAYSRLVFSLSRAGYLPRFLSVTNRANSPYLGILIPGVLAFVLTLTGSAEKFVVVSITCATLCYVILMAAHIKLRMSEPDLPRPYRTPGGVATSGVTLLLGVLSLVICIEMSPQWAAFTIFIIALFILYFHFYGRHHLVANAPEEQLAIFAHPMD